jgi:hypothetical protein
MKAAFVQLLSRSSLTHAYTVSLCLLLYIPLRNSAQHPQHFPPTHAHVHTHTHTHPHIHNITITHSLTHSTHVHTLTLTLSLSHSRFRSRSLSLSFSRTPRSLTHSPTHPLAHTLSVSRAHSHTHSLSRRESKETPTQLWGSPQRIDRRKRCFLARSRVR